MGMEMSEGGKTCFLLHPELIDELIVALGRTRVTACLKGKMRPLERSVHAFPCALHLALFRRMNATI